MCLEPREPLPDELGAIDTVVEFLDDFSAAMVNARIYAPDHPRVRTSIDAALGFLRELPAFRESSFRLSVADDLLVYGTYPLLGASVTASRLVRALETLGSGGIEIDGNATAEDLLSLITKLGTIRGSSTDWTAINDDLRDTGFMSARLLPPFIESRPGEVSFSKDLTAPVRFYQSCIDLLQDVTVSVCHGGHIDFAPVRAQAEAVLRHLEEDNGPLMNLARQDQYDAFTFGHSVRVAVLAMNFARALTDDRELLLRIGVASLLHDCGKALVPFEILHSRNALGPEERVKMNHHAQFGAEILVDHDDADPLSVASAFGHHRSCDGGGYPATYHEHQNQLVTEIVKVCDVYEALTAARPYKRPMSPVRAYRVMISMGEHLDRTLLKRFIQVNGIRPIGQLLELTTGERGRVFAQTDDLLLPIVQIVTDAEGTPLELDKRRTLDLRQAKADGGPGVVGPADEEIVVKNARS